MLQLAKNIIDYLKDLSDFEITSSTDVEDLQLKREILFTNILLFVIGAGVIGTIIFLFLFYLPGLYNVFVQIFFYYLASLIAYWPLVIVLVILFTIVLYYTLKHY